MTKIVRTPTKATGGVTPEELEKMKAHSDMWIKRIMRTEPADYDQLKAAIEGLYEVSGLKKPRVILVPSPLVMVFAYGASVAILKKYSNDTWNATENATRNATWNVTDDVTLNATENATENATWNATRNATSIATRNATWNATHDVTLNATWNATWNATHGATRNATLNATDIATRNATLNATLNATENATLNATLNATENATRNATYNATRNATLNATYDATANATYDGTLNATWNATWNATRNATENATRNATENATRNATDNATSNATWNATWNATRNATWNVTDDVTLNATDDATRNATANATWNVTDDVTLNATYDATRNAIKNQVDQAVQACYTLAGQEGLEYAKKWTSVYQGGAYWGSHVCYMTAMRDILNLKLPEFEKYKYWEQAAIHGTFRVMHEDFCIVSDFPEVLKVDDQNRAHCQDGPSHRWRDGWEQYHWHGVQVPKEWIMNPGHLTAKMALTWENIEERRAACEILGWAKILKELKAKVIDTDGDPEIGELVEVDLPDIGKEKFLRVLCGTGREFALPVPPDMKTALQAQSWTWGIDQKDFIKPEIRT